MKKLFFGVGVSVLPVLVFATNHEGLDKFIDTLSGWINALIPIAFALAVLLFFYGVAMFIFQTGNGKDEGKKIMLWGLVGLFVMSSVFGIIKFAATSIGVNSGTDSITVPKIK